MIGELLHVRLTDLHFVPEHKDCFLQLFPKRFYSSSEDFYLPISRLNLILVLLSLFMYHKG